MIHRFPVVIRSALLGAVMAGTAAADELATVAESSSFQATATHEQVVDLLQQIAARSDRVHLAELGRSVEGRSIPLAVIADPPVRGPEDVVSGDRLVVLVFGNIHAGEVCGKEALLMLARELALDDHPDLLEHLVLLLVPNLNADGNERFDPDNRPGQVGPAQGMGQRPNAQGLDLNRDWVKLESPEIRALVQLLSSWDPHLTIDTHTTNGSRHRYLLTYEAPLNPSGFGPSIAFLREELLPAVTDSLRRRTGFETFFYGNFDREHATWSTYSAQPRFGGPYRGLRGQMSILSEAYAYATYEQRVRVTLEFVREVLVTAAERRDRIRQLHDQARARTIAAGRDPQPDDVVGLRHRLAAFTEPVVVAGYEPIDEASTELRPRDYTVVHRGRFEPVVSVRRPAAYLVPAGHDPLVEALRRHGIDVLPFAGPAAVERYTVRRVTRSRRPFQGHRLVRLDVTAARDSVDLPEGSWIVPTAQPLGTLAVYLLEPYSEDGLATWNLLDGALIEGEPYPVLRVDGE
jgi:hypothetical protein